MRRILVLSLVMSGCIPDLYTGKVESLGPVLKMNGLQIHHRMN